jgi:hypothetical protein
VERRSRSLGPRSFAFAGQPKEKHAVSETKYMVRGSRSKSGTRQMPSRIDTIRLGDSVILQTRKFNINNTQRCKSSQKVSVIIRSVVYDVLNDRNTFGLRVSKFILLRLPDPEDQGTILLERRKLSTQRHVGLYSPVALPLKPQTPQCSGNVRFRLLHFVLVSFNDAVNCWHYKASVTEDFTCMDHWRRCCDRGKENTQKSVPVPLLNTFQTDWPSIETMPSGNKIRRLPT